MKRKLVCTNDTSGHWARRRFAPHMLSLEEQKPARKPFWRGEEMGLFMLSYFAFFTAVYTFIA